MRPRGKPRTELISSPTPSFDITGDDPANVHASGGGLISRREIMVGMIEEYSGHLGDVDILRELIDGRPAKSAKAPSAP